MQPFSVGPYRVTAVPANHDPTVEPLLYVIEKDGQTVFYGTDTAELFEDTWRVFHQQAIRLDLVILDHTYGPNASGSDHLSARQFIDHIRRMREERLLNDNARAFATHIAHEGNLAHPQLCDFAAQYGYHIAYDGLTLTIPDQE
ncbi:hypothetical protein CSA56_00725 [candidate division KSB3 bacterium]|uniref:Metallo-beta-lactamase domain-containing protein n=1 Tax=candidate division KSB3 bacterium TaxID=2044937 RepID=A0A2G6KKR0_9BACT|nr:MAG: hypothetical protein CSA56_00725 [candidate division KSB3 bacterium]